MNEIMTPSAEMTTPGQIDKAVANYRAMLEKHAPNFTAAAVQEVLGQPELARAQFEIFRTRVEAISDMIVRRVKVDRSITSQAALEATGRKLYVTPEVVAGMPVGEGDEVDVFFFKPDLSSRDGYISDDDLAREYELRGLKPDPRAQAAVNQAEPAFADERPNACHWKDQNGNWCFEAFDLWGVGRGVDVLQFDDEWDGYWSFAGVRK